MKDKKTIKEILDKQKKINERKYKKNNKPLTKEDWFIYIFLSIGFVILIGVVLPYFKQ